MLQKFIIVGGIVALMGSWCETSQGNGGQGGIEASSSDILTKPSATDQAETATASTDSVAVITADTIPQTH